MRRRALRLLTTLLLLLLPLSGIGCVRRFGGVHAEMKEIAKGRDPSALCEALEQLIDQGRDRRADREYAYEQMKQFPPVESAEYYYVLAAITGRLVQERGLLGAPQIPEIERAAEKSRALDPHFNGGAATRLLGTLYVIAPATLLEHGDSETGLELLEQLTEELSDVPQNHLRLAEAYIALNDPTPAQPHLCFCMARREQLRPDEQRLLDQLLRGTGPLLCAPT